MCETCKDTFEKIQKMYEEDCLSRKQACEWFKRFKDGCEVLKMLSDMKTFNQHKLLRVDVLENYRTTIRGVADDLILILDKFNQYILRM